ncbi:exo-beta-N-acetylmuramidase NamZ family protein [Lacticaseibacillus jixiensis]|uniref:exo-beta-N-acetylmuramidase NamZ family protein n=1 Tax=Lacticaseibacillus jixiensis TaxID=3231926 RepID=UPI0036F1FAE2
MNKTQAVVQCGQYFKKKGDKMLVGVENIAAYSSLIRHARIGLVTNFSGLTSRFEPTGSVLNQFGTVVKLFAPEYGLHGLNAGHETVADVACDPQLKVPVVSLYGEKFMPDFTDLADLDVVVFDIQDTGVRYHSFINTLLRVMQKAEQAGKPMIVMDRPLPIGRKQPLGTRLAPAYMSFVGLLATPALYGLTIGELARWIQATQLPELQLEVVPLINWNPHLTITQNGLPWQAPSPNLPTEAAVRLYPGLGLLDGTNISVGRGTVRPFEQIGAPFIDGIKLAKRLRQLASQRGRVGFKPIWFKPMQGRYAGQICQGVQLHVQDNGLNPLRLGAEILANLAALYPAELVYTKPLPQLGTAHTYLEYLCGRVMQTPYDIAQLTASSDYNPAFQLETAGYYLY